jgi:hypothetical protein
MFRMPVLAAVAAVAVSLVSASSALAVSFTVTGGTNYALPANYSLAPETGPELQVGTVVVRNGTLALTAPGRVTFTYLGSEAGYSNRFTVTGGGFHNKSGTNGAFSADFLAGLLGFSFSTDDPAGSVANGESSGWHHSIALYQPAGNSRRVYALFNDSSTSDKDYDDLVVRLDVAPIPLPAAAWLLVAGIGGLGLAARRRRS